MEERYRDSMAAKAFEEAVIEKHPRTINEAVKYAPMIEADKLREEQWEEFDKEDKEKSEESNSDRFRVIEVRKPYKGVAQVRVEAPKKTSTQFGAKGGKIKSLVPGGTSHVTSVRWWDTYRRTVHLS